MLMNLAIAQFNSNLTARLNRAKMRAVLPLFLLIATSLSVAVSTQTLAAVEIERVEGATVYFKSTSPTVPALRPLLTHLHEIQVLGLIQRDDSVPHVLLLARPCSDCSVERALYLVSGLGGRPQRFDQPGRILDPKKDMWRTNPEVFWPPPE